MGPPIYIGGNFLVPGVNVDLNEGASMGPPIYIGGNIPIPLQYITIARLQWGHRFTSVETQRWTDQAATKRRFNGATDLHRWKRKGWNMPLNFSGWASMGPPIYIGGNSFSDRVFL